MSYITRTIEGVPLVCHSVMPCHSRLGDFPNCCGAGDGLGEKVVPDTILFLRVSPACYIHDYDFEISPPTWEAYRANNERFWTNLISIIRHKSANKVAYIIRAAIAGVYFAFVDGVSVVFWSLKRQQIMAGMWPGYEMPTGREHGE